MSLDRLMLDMPTMIRVHTGTTYTNVKEESHEMFCIFITVNYVYPIEEGRERLVTSYLRQWTQVIRLYMGGGF